MLLDEGLVLSVERVQLLAADWHSEVAVVPAQYAHNYLNKARLAQNTACHVRLMFLPLLDREYGPASFGGLQLEK